MAEIIEGAPPAKRAKPAPLADEKAPRPRNVLLAEFEGLAKEDASQALRRIGMALVHDHILLHESPELRVGVKHVIRTDVMYERVR